MYAATEHGLWFVTNPVPGKPSVILKRLDFASGAIRDMATIDFVPIPVGLVGVGRRALRAHHPERPQRQRPAARHRLPLTAIPDAPR